MANEVTLHNAQASFVHLAEPQTYKGVNKNTGEVETSVVYQLDFLMQPDSQNYKKFMGELANVAQAKWGDNFQVFYAMVQKDRKQRCFGKGEEKVSSKTGKVYAGYDKPGAVFVSASRKKTPPQVIGHEGAYNGVAIPPDSSAFKASLSKISGGCIVNAVIRPWVQSAASGYGHALRCELIAIQFAEEGESFGKDDIDVSAHFGAIAAPAVAPMAVMPGLPSFLG